MRKNAASDPDLNERLEQVFRNIEGSAVGSQSEGDIKGLFDDLDVNSAKLGNTVAARNAKLVRILNEIGNLPLGDFSSHSIDMFWGCLRVLDDNVRIFSRQVGWRVLHPAGRF